jgi:thiol:disulfide interchange protein
VKKTLVVMMALVLVAASLAPAAQPAPAIRAALNCKEIPAGGQAVLAVVVEVPAGYHIQSHTPLSPQFIATDLKVESDPSLQVFAPVYPAGAIRNYPALGQLSEYEGRVIIYVPLQAKPGAHAGAITIAGTLRYQMCDEQICFAPQTPGWSVQASIATAGTAMVPNEPELFAGFDPSTFAKVVGPAPASPAAAPKVSLFGHELAAGSYLFPFFAAFLIGIIFNVMPCVLPVVPLKIIGFYEVSQHRRSLSLALGLVFSAGIVSVFTVLGLLVVVLRALDWGQLYGNPWFLGGVIVLLIILALSLFGVFTVVLPQGVYRFAPRHDTYPGNFLFGILTAVLSTPCTFGLFFGLLVWAVAQPAAIGLALMVTVGIGMAFPYMVLSAAPEVARRFPRTGVWAELIKQMMGFLLLASAVFFARRFLQGWFGEKVFWWALFAVVAAAGGYLLARTFQFSRTLIPRLAAAVVALALVGPAFAFTWRQTNPPIDWQRFSPEAVAEARKSGKIVVVEFTAAWCLNCITVETTVFHDQRTVDAFRDHKVVALRADLTDQHAVGWETLRQLSAIAAIPLTAVYSPQLPQPIELSGIYTTADLVAALQRASAGGGNAVSGSVPPRGG